MIFYRLIRILPMCLKMVIQMLHKLKSSTYYTCLIKGKLKIAEVAKALTLLPTNPGILRKHGLKQNTG